MSQEQTKIFLRVLCIDVKTRLKKVQSVKTVINQAGSSVQVSRNQTSRDDVIEEEVIESWFPFRSDMSEDSQQNPLLRKMEASTKFSRVIKSLLNTLVECYDGPSQNEGEGVSLSDCELFTTKEVPTGGMYHFDDMDGDAFDLETVALIDHQCTAADLGITVSDHGDPSSSLTLLLKFHSTPTYSNESTFRGVSPPSASIPPPTIGSPTPLTDVIPVKPSPKPHTEDPPQPAIHIHHQSHVYQPPSQSQHPIIPKVAVPHSAVNSSMRNGRGNTSFSCDLPSTTALGPMRDKLRRQQLSAPHEMTVQHLEPWPSVRYGRSAAPVHFYNTSSSSSVRRPSPRAVPTVVSSVDRGRPSHYQNHSNHSLNQSNNHHYNTRGDDNNMDEISMLRRKLEEEKRKRHLAEMEVLSVYNSPSREAKTAYHHHHKSDAVGEEPADIDEIALREHRLLMERLKTQRSSRSAPRN